MRGDGNIAGLEFDHPVPLRPENGPQTLQKLRVFGRCALDSSYYDVVLAADGSAVGAISETKLKAVLRDQGKTPR